MTTYYKYIIVNDPRKDHEYITFFDEVEEKELLKDCYKSLEEATKAASDEIEKLKGE